MATLAENIETAIETLGEALGDVAACGETDRAKELAEAITALKELQQLEDEPVEVTTQGYT